MIHFLKVVPPSVSTFSEGALGWWCCDARLVNRQGKPAMTRSAKLERLIDMVGELAAEWRKVIFFSQFASMPDLIRLRLEASGIADEVVKDKKRDVAESLIDRDAHPSLAVTEADIASLHRLSAKPAIGPSWQIFDRRQKFTHKRRASLVRAGPGDDLPDRWDPTSGLPWRCSCRASRIVGDLEAVPRPADPDGNSRRDAL
ncbi:hypothetical protein [Jiella pelagia]|uniref:Uncharacterized protein n=1 Tax=Jiella pelagia TaxID=2986949 RepID=A0ABY7C318_9HYPH|nr:hypothetical protein [Jiella pelagia]WAP70284.1 hypothetical protein OH818_09415 [Jiella pelagia]